VGGIGREGETALLNREESQSMRSASRRENEVLTMGRGARVGLCAQGLDADQKRTEGVEDCIRQMWYGNKSHRFSIH
jgi:hypothetical protein